HRSFAVSVLHVDSETSEFIGRLPPTAVAIVPVLLSELTTGVAESGPSLEHRIHRIDHTTRIKPTARHRNLPSGQNHAPHIEAVDVGHTPTRLFLLHSEVTVATRIPVVWSACAPAILANPKLVI